MKKIVLCSAAILIALSSCTHRLTDFTVISTKNMPIGSGQPSNIVKADKRVVGKDGKLMILGIPLGTPNLKQAIDNAIESYPGASGLADGVVKSTGWFALLVGKTGYKVEGTPIYESKEGNFTSSKLVQENQGTEVMVFFHEVKAGEKIADVAKNYGVSIADIIKWNNLTSTEITKGTKLKVLIK